MTKMNSFLAKSVAALALAASFTACESDSDSPKASSQNEAYTVSLGITSNGTTTYYIVSTDDLMSDTINAVGKGIEQNGYHDYIQGPHSVFSIGGLGVTDVTTIQRSQNGQLEEGGSFIFDNRIDEFRAVDDQTMLGLEVPANSASGQNLTFYTVDARSAEILQKHKSNTVAPLSDKEWPSVTGMEISGGKVYVAYVPMNTNNYATPYTDECYVAVYDYPSLSFRTLMTDTRVGNAGSWNAYNAFLKDEQGNLYVMSNSALANGFSQATRKAGFLRIGSGKTTFDSDYFFDFEAVSGGLKPAHVQYVGNGKVYAEVSTLNPQTASDRWSDRSLKCCIIDLVKKTVTDVEGIPVHNGNGGRRFAVLVEDGQVYHCIESEGNSYIYRTDVATAKAVRGAKVEATFVAGIFGM
jgi:hypothetical protein